MIEEVVLKYALANAVKYGGKADVKAVMSKIMAEMPELRQRAKEVKQLVEKVVEQVNAMSKDEQFKLLQERWPEILEERKPEQRRPGIESLPELPKAKGGVVVRFAPNPDFVLHLGSARPAI
jgi:glutamyl-tRNA synthetase (EC 6.1.1.17)